MGWLFFLALGSMSRSTYGVALHEAGLAGGEAQFLSAKLG